MSFSDFVVVKQGLLVNHEQVVKVEWVSSPQPAVAAVLVTPVVGPAIRVEGEEAVSIWKLFSNTAIQIRFAAGERANWAAALRSLAMELSATHDFEKHAQICRAILQITKQIDPGAFRWPLIQELTQTPKVVNG